MTSIPFIQKKIGDSRLVWFQNSNLYLQLKEPAWFVFGKTVKRYKATTIAELVTKRYAVPIKESLQFVQEIRAEIAKMNQPVHTPNNIDQLSTEINKHLFTPHSIYHYKLGNQVIRFSFASAHFESYIHPLISHFETSENLSNMPLFELFSYRDRIVFRHNGLARGLWTKDETQYVKGSIFMFLVNAMHDKTDDHWLMTVHASAITNGRKTILFSAEPGKGKTTFAALLQAQGYQLISDDFVPIDRHTFSAYPFPISVSVKPGSMDLLTPLFPELGKKSLTHLSAEKSVRYITPSNHSDIINAIFPVKELIFIEYNNAVDFNLEKLDPVVALKSLLNQVWVTPVHGNASILLDRVMEFSFYKLTYSNNQKALGAISNLFEHD
jgi:hypothetical protein